MCRVVKPSSLQLFYSCVWTYILRRMRKEAEREKRECKQSFHFYIFFFASLGRAGGHILPSAPPVLHCSNKWTWFLLQRLCFSGFIRHIDVKILCWLIFIIIVVNYVDQSFLPYLPASWNQRCNMQHSRLSVSWCVFCRASSVFYTDIDSASSTAGLNLGQQTPPPQFHLHTFYTERRGGITVQYPCCKRGICVPFSPAGDSAIKTAAYSSETEIIVI